MLYKVSNVKLLGFLQGPKLKIIQGLFNHIIRDYCMPYFKTFFGFLEDENIERTSSMIENVFQRTFPKRVKRLMKIKRGVISRINIRIDIQNQIKLFDGHLPSF